MTRDEARSVFLELKKIYPHAKQLKSGEVLEAYGKVLMRYDFSAVMASVANYTATGKYFPDLADLVGGLTPVLEPTPGNVPRPPAEWMLPYLAADKDCDRKSISYYMRTQGLTLEEARARVRRMEETL